MDVNRKDKITELTDAVVVAAHVAASAPRRTIWWRGHARLEWQLVPEVWRGPQGYDPTWEQDAALRFRAHAGTRHAHCPPVSDTPSWLFLMRHYGGPTRLLDWSLSPLVALFFATETDDSVNGTLWGLSPGGLNKAQVGDMGLFVPHTKKLQPFFNAAFGDAPGPSPEKIIAIAPHETDVRMLVQQSVFTIHGTSRDLATLEEASTFLWRCDVDASAKDLIRRELDLLGIDRFRLFPDLSTLGREVGRIHAENRPDPPQAKK